MNWRKIDESWHTFAQNNGVELNYTERNLLHAIECRYTIEFSTELGHSVFTGILWKNQDGHNRNRTNIKTRLKTQRLLKNLEIKRTGFKSLIRNKLSSQNKHINRSLRLLNGSHLTLNDNVLYIELHEILSTQTDFNKVLDLITLVATDSE